MSELLWVSGQKVSYCPVRELATVFFGGQQQTWMVLPLGERGAEPWDVQLWLTGLS